MEKILAKLNIEKLNDMQVAMLDAFEKDSDLILISPTGSGKTLGFLLPILSRLDHEVAGIQAIVIAPSRELALQIEQVFRNMGTGFKVNCCYGGHPMYVEKRNLLHPPALLVGTPGRILDHIRRGHIETDSIQYLVLDEFDKSLEFGFHEQMGDIIRDLKSLKKRLLISATDAVDIPNFTGITDPIKLNFTKESSLNDRLQFKSIISPSSDKLDSLYQLICHLGNESTLVFCNHRSATERVSNYLSEHNIIHGLFHGGLEQYDREKVLSTFRNGSIQLLINTDLAARGLDIPAIKYIIHYHLPDKGDAFIHRNGRTARVSENGTVYLIITEKETLPDYITKMPEVEILPEFYAAPSEPEWITLRLNKGKKDKINKVDIVGFLSKKGELKRDELGLIELKDFYAIVAVKRNLSDSLLSKIKNEKIKNKKVRFEYLKE